MFILSSIALCGVLTYHEARSADFIDQYYVASTVYNRSESKNKTVSEIVFEKNQYSSMKKFKPITKFNNFNSMLKYYNLTDVSSYASAVNACGFAVENQNKFLYFHDHSIKKFNWNAGAPAVKTKSFNFYN